MFNLKYSITINAPREKVWDIMLGDETYRQWTDVFSPGSYYQGDWSQGSRIVFVGPDPETDKEGGMVARIKENRLHEYISIEQYAMISNGVEENFPGDGKIYENYTFSDKDGGTLVEVELIDLPDEYKGMFEESWPTALEKLKELAEA